MAPVNSPQAIGDLLRSALKVAGRHGHSGPSILDLLWLRTHTDCKRILVASRANWLRNFAAHPNGDSEMGSRLGFVLLQGSLGDNPLQPVCLLSSASRKQRRLGWLAGQHHSEPCDRNPKHRKAKPLCHDHTCVSNSNINSSLGVCSCWKPLLTSAPQEISQTPTHGGAAQT